MAAHSPLVASAPSRGSGIDVDADEDIDAASKSVSPGALLWVEGYAQSKVASNGNQAAADQRGLLHVLVRAEEEALADVAEKFVQFCTLIPKLIEGISEEKLASEQTLYHQVLHGYILEVFCAIVERTVAKLSSVAKGDLSVLGTGIPELLSAFSTALDPENAFYDWRREHSMAGVNVVFPHRLTAVLKVPGYRVRVADGGDSNDFYYCCDEGVNFNGEGCECCKPPDDADAVRTYLHWLMAKTASGSGYEHTMTILEAPKQLSLPMIASLLRPLHQLHWVDTTNNACRKIFRHVEGNFKGKFNGTMQDRFRNICSELVQYLDDLILEMTPVPPCYDHVGLQEALFIFVIHEIHKVSCWSLSDDPELHRMRDELRKLQEKVCERLLDAGNNGRVHYLSWGLLFVGAAIEATVGPIPKSGNNALFSLKWLREKDIIRRLLQNLYAIPSVAKVNQFLAILVKKGVVIEEKDCVKRLKLGAQRPPVRPFTIEICNAADLICANMLEMLDFSPYSDNFVECVLQWLEARQADSVFRHSRIFNILKKLLLCDRNGRWKDRFYALLRNCSSDTSNKDLVEFLREVSSHSVIGTLVATNLAMADGHEELLEACSDADSKRNLKNDITQGSRTQTATYLLQAHSWTEKELSLEMHSNAPVQPTTALSAALPYRRHEVARKCLDRLDLANLLSTDLNPNKSSTFALMVPSTMSPELHTLEALKNETSLRCKVVQQLVQLREMHMEQYNALKQEQYKRLAEFSEACCKEEQDVVWNAMQQKVNLMTSVDRVGVNEDKLSSHEILRRLLLSAGGACKQMEDKCKKSSESLLHAKCVVCFSKFSSKRKRACLDPCGHTNACVDCATQEWKRSKKCSVCKTSIEKPIPVPFKLFF